MDALELHAERVPGDPATLRWVLPHDVPPDGGPALRRLIDAGVLTAVVTEPGSVRTALAAGRTWRAEGDGVRAAVREALAAPVDAPGDVVHDDAALRRVVLEVLTGPAGTYVGSHGGRAELVDVAAGVVTVRLGGACTHCPAAGVTLDRTLEREIRDRYSALVAVRRAPGTGADRRAALWPSGITSLVTSRVTSRVTSHADRPSRA